MMYLIKIRKSRGGHWDVYFDFEEQILKFTGWRYKYETKKVFRSLFWRFFLNLLRKNSYKLNLPILRSSNCLFSILNGPEYAKIFHCFAFNSRLKAIYLFDPYPSDNYLHANAFRTFNINVAFISAQQAVTYFNNLKIDNFKAYWIPEGIDSSKYNFLDEKHKEIDVLQYGRRWEWYHEKILDFCNEKGINYKFPSSKDKKQFVTRDELVQALAMTKIAVCVPRSITNPETHENLETLTTRYFECMSSKCLIIGHAPVELVELFGYNPVVEIDKENLQSQLEYILNNFHEYSSLIDKNHKLVLENHQWQNRIEQIINKLQHHL